jgi:ornithine carbamoyltransferase
MGDEDQAAERRKAFVPYQVNSALMGRASAGCKFMHCLPAHRGDEVTDEVLDGPDSIVLDQAENRLHIQRAIVAELIARNQQESAPGGRS